MALERTVRLTTGFLLGIFEEFTRSFGLVLAIAKHLEFTITIIAANG